MRFGNGRSPPAHLAGKSARSGCKKLEHPALSIADEDTRPNAVRVNPLGAKKGYDPYDSGKLGKKPEKQKTDLRKLGEWLKLKKQAEKNKEKESKD